MFYQEKEAIIVFKFIKQSKAIIIIMMIVPRSWELSSKIMYLKIKDYFSEIILYFSEYEEQDHYLQPKKFMWDIFSTFNNDLVHKCIVNSIK